MKLFKILLIILCLPVSVFCQDITGIWTGTLYNDSTLSFSKYEIGIVKQNGKYSGFSHTCFTIDSLPYFAVKSLNVKKAPDGKIIITDDKPIYNNYPVAPNKNVRQLSVLSVESDGNNDMFRGIFVTNRTKQFLPLTGTVSLTKITDPSASELVHQLKNIGKLNESGLLGESMETLASIDKK
jgi:hypothetical protein